MPLSFYDAQRSVARCFPAGRYGWLAVVMAGTTLFSALSAAAARLQDIAPTEVTYGKEAEVTVSLSRPAAQARFTLLPGGAYLKTTVHAGVPVRDLMIRDGMLYFVTPQGVKRLALEKAFSTQEVALEPPLTSWAVAGDIAYVGNDRREIEAVMLTGEQAMTVVTRLPVHGQVTALQATPDYLYALIDGRRLLVFELRDARTPLFVSQQRVSTATAMAVQGDVVYLAGAQGVEIFRHEQQGQLRLVSRYQTLAPAWDLAVAEDHLYVALGASGLLVVSVSAPESPRWLGSHAMLGDVRLVRIAAGRLALATREGVIRILELDAAAHPVISASYATQDAIEALAWDGAALWFAQGGELKCVAAGGATPAYTNENLDAGQGVNFGGERRIFIDGTRAYVADWFSGIHIYDISTPHWPRLLASFHTPGSPKGIVVRDGVAFVADDDHGLQIIDVQDPTQPQWLAQLPTSGLAYIPKLAGDRLYLAGHRGGFHIIDISDVRTPQLLGEYDTPGKAWAIAVDGAIAYVADDSAGLLVFDVSEAQQPQLLGAFNPQGMAEDVVLKEHLAFVTFYDQGLYVLDVSNPRQPQPLAHLELPGNARGIVLHGRYAYVATWLAGVQIVDISNPAHPRVVGSYDTKGASWGVAVRGDQAYIADWWGGFAVLDVSDVRRPRLQGHYHERGTVRQAATVGRFAFVAQGAGGLQIFEISNPLNPMWVTGVDVDGEVYGVALQEGYAWLAAGKRGLVGVDIHDSYAPRRVASLANIGDVRRIKLDGQRVYLLDAKQNLFMVDVSQPQQPRLGQARLVGVRDFAVYKHELYVLRAGALERFTWSEQQVPQRTLQQVLPAQAWHLAVQGEGVFIAIDGVGIAHYRQRGEQMELLSTLKHAENVTDLRAAGDQLYVSDKQGVTVFSNTAVPPGAWLMHYPLTSQPGLLALHEDVIYMGGNASLIALQTLPALESQALDDQHYRLRLSQDLPLGSYHLRVQEGEEVEVIPNAVQVVMPRFSKPNFSLDDLNKAMQQYQR